jgi:hypothetical protein
VSVGEWIVSERAEPNVVTRELAAGPTHINTVAAIVCLRRIHILCHLRQRSCSLHHNPTLSSDGTPSRIKKNTQCCCLRRPSAPREECPCRIHPALLPSVPSATASSPPSAGRLTHRRRAATHFSPPTSWPFPKSRKKATKPLEIRQHLQTTSSARTVAEDDVPGT